MEKKAKKLDLPECIRALMVSDEAQILFGPDITHKTEAAIEAFLMKAYEAGKEEGQDLVYRDLDSRGIDYSGYYSGCPCGCGG